MFFPAQDIFDLCAFETEFRRVGVALFPVSVLFCSLWGRRGVSQGSDSSFFILFAFGRLLCYAEKQR